MGNLRASVVVLFTAAVSLVLLLMTRRTTPAKHPFEETLAVWG